MEFKLSVDAITVKGVLNKLKKGITNPTVPLGESKDWLLSDVKKNFATEGALYGKWKPLAPSTIRSKERLGYGGKQILERTGTLKRGIMGYSTDKKAVIYNDVDYFGVHQKGRGKGRGSVPQRVIFNISREGMNAIANIFAKWIVKMLI